VGEPDLLRNMLENLIRNALRFTPEDGRVVVRAEVRGDRAVVRVVDEGPGIPEDQLGRIFERFSQADNQSVGTKGHGLGLAIAQEIARLHGGEISVRNGERGGCVFSVHLPLEMQG
jgi:signal transduction histidine kinase